jgi:hypothetical protein
MNETSDLMTSIIKSKKNLRVADVDGQCGNDEAQQSEQDAQDNEQHRIALGRPPGGAT